MNEVERREKQCWLLKELEALSFAIGFISNWHKDKLKFPLLELYSLSDELQTQILELSTSVGK